MQNTIQYVQLRQQLDPNGRVSAVSITREELADLLICTPRNVKFVLRKWEDNGWIAWLPGSGRGHRSLLTFLMPVEELLLQEAKTAADKGDLHLAFDLIGSYGEGTQTREAFTQWLTASFGYSHERREYSSFEVLRMPVTRQIITLDPGDVNFALDAHMVKQIFDRLVVYNKQSGLIEPQLAHVWSCNEDASEWTLHLRKGVIFHHGRELTADDVVYSLQRFLEPERIYFQRWMFQHITLVEARGRYTVYLKLAVGNQIFLRFLSMPQASILPRDVGERLGCDFAKHPIGTGPFRCVCYKANSCKLEANPSYFQGRPHLDRVEVVSLPLDYCAALSMDENDFIAISHDGKVHAKRPDWPTQQLTAECLNAIVFNEAKDGPQRNPLFRKALHHLVNHKAMVQHLKETRTMPANGFPHMESQDWVDDYNPDLAAKLLLDMNYQGEPFKLMTHCKKEADALWLEQQFNLLGIRTEIHYTQSIQWEEPGFLKQFDAVMCGLVLEEDVVSILEFISLDASLVQTHFSGERQHELQQWITEIYAERDEPGRHQKILEMEALLRERNVVLFLTFSSMQASYHPSLRGVSLNSLGWVDFRDLWFQPEHVS